MAKKQAKSKKPSRVQSVLAGILVLIVLIVVGYCIGWGVTGSYNPAEWVKGGSATETPAKPVEYGASIHTHALSASSDEDPDAGIELYALKCLSCGKNTALSETIAATCIEDGKSITSCSNCSYYRETTIPALGHSCSWQVTTAPTADEAGEASYICNRCSAVTDTRAVYALPADPVKEGYHFVGWYLDEALTQAYDNSPIYEDTQLYAKFEINVYTVIFDSDGGNDIERLTVDWNTVITPAEPEKTGYNFLGWYLDDDTEYDGQAVKENTTLTAHWQIKTFTVMFYVEGELYTTVTVDYGTSLGAVADVAEVFLNNIVSFANVNGETPEVTADKMTVSDDMIVVANKPSTFEKIWKYKYTPYIIGGVCAIVALGVAVTVIEKKKKQV